MIDVADRSDRSEHVFWLTNFQTFFLQKMSTNVWVSMKYMYSGTLIDSHCIDMGLTFFFFQRLLNGQTACPLAPSRMGCMGCRLGSRCDPLERTLETIFFL